MASDTDQLTQDTVFDILSSSRRRYVLYYLRTVGEPIELTELAEHVAAWENDCTVEELTSQQRKRVYVSMYQTHVPKLESVGLVDYDRDSGDVSLTNQAYQIDTYLSDSEQTFPWQYLYFALSIVSAALLVLVWLDISVFGLVPTVAAALVVTGAFLVAAITHYLIWRSERRQVPSEYWRRGE
jgi:hypothetical protein